jgi:alpha-mannosidase
VGFPREPSWLENEFLRADIDTVDGTLRVTDKRTGAVFGGLNRFVDGGDAGDEYTYSPPPRDKLVSHERAIVETIDIGHTADCQTAEINLRLRVPAELSEDRHSRSTSDAWLVVVSRIKVHPGVARVDVEVEVENSASDHRLRVHFPFPFSVTHADHDGHWEVVRRPAGDPTFQHENWVEQPCAQVPQRAFTSVCGDGVGLMVANRGLPEVAVLPREDGQGGDIALTLLRCVGWLSRDDLSTRRGHAGPMIATPGAQMPGTHTFKYAVIPHAGDWREAFLQAYADNAPMRAVSTRLHEGMLEPSGSFLQVQPAGLVLSAIKEAEDGVGWIARCYNITDEPVVGRLTPWRRFGSVSLVNLAERELSALSVQADGAVVVPVAPHQVITGRWRDSQEGP